MGTLYIVPTPIGNLEDITIRAIKTLFSVDYIACEDTRRTGILLQELKKRYFNSLLSTSIATSDKSRIVLELSSRLRSNNKIPILIPYYDEVEIYKIPEIVQYLSDDKNIALVSDSGSPVIADPGYKLIVAAMKSDIPIITLPGPTSVIPALVASGFPPNRFYFIGFIEKQSRAKKDQLMQVKTMWQASSKGITVVAFESPKRFMETLEILKEIFGDIQISVSREMTKIHENIYRGTISELQNSSPLLKGEIVLTFYIGGDKS
ncbi:16S rRNA (cytidine(1402)-2'-O)-methyltransferase [Candidatus Gottesmanbacteria bacterium]|nr:16S rRNA (cytidine(1402)-2'-O)-methyltransferase [Candidatus Gottesmanbacteria bacterium]